MRVKICGVNSPDAFAAAAEAGADYIGFVFFERSPRHVSPATAATLAATRPRGPALVGLFVDPTDAAIEAALAALPLDILQLYAPAPRAASIRTRFGLPVWRSVALAPETPLPASTDGADALLIEPRPPAGATRPGGNALALDPTRLATWRPSFDWILAGGLRPETVAAAIRASNAPAVDVSSGVETAPGVKSPALIRAFTASARASGGPGSAQDPLGPRGPRPHH